MKKLSMVLAVLMIVSVCPMTLFAGSDYIIENDTISIPKATPTVDATISDEDGWSQKAFFNIDTASNFWSGNPLTVNADLYFAYSDDGLYFAGDITDESHDNGNNFVYSTGEDDINDIYGWNGDVFTLMIDPLDGLFNAGYFGNSDYTPWYHIGLFKNSDGTETARLYRNKVNEGELTAKDGVLLAGKSTEKGWLVEAYIPWSVISADIYGISVGGVDISAEELAADGATFSGAIMYQDRYLMSSGTVDTWGRYITVCETCEDGTPGYWSSGVCIKALGLNMVNYDHSAHHEWSEWVESLAPTCKDDGQESRSCSVCGETETRPVAASGEHSFGDWAVTTAPTCTENGIESRSCAGCGVTETRSIAAGHSFGEWKTTTEPTPDKEGEKQRVCSGCGMTETEIIPAIGDVTVTAENYTVKIGGAGQIENISYAPGELSDSGDILASAGRVDISATDIAAGTVDGTFVYEMPDGGVYSLVITLTDGNSFVETVDLTAMIQTVSSKGLTLTVHNLYGVKDFFVAKGNYSTYRELKNSDSDLRFDPNKNGNVKDLSCILKEAGDYTVCIRYNDGRDHLILYHTLEVVMPEIAVDGLQVSVANLEDIKVIRTAPGVWTTSGEVKRAEGCRNFTARNSIKVSDPFVIQYRADGVYTVVVEYTTGLCVVETVDIAHKEPTFEQNGSTVTFGDLDGLYVIRYAQGEYSTSSEIKRAPGSKFVRPSAAVDGKITIEGLGSGTYTFCVQYKDESYNYYTVNTHKFGDWYVVTAATTSADGKEARKCETCGETEERVIPTIKMTIAGNDISRYKIIYGSSAASPVKTAANNLRDWISECYGVTLTVTTDSTAASDYEILVGKTNREAQGLVTVDCSSENELSYVINVQGSRLVIAGHTDSSRRRGTLYGAYYFAEEVLGYHFLLDSLIVKNPRAAHLTSEYSVHDGPGYEMRTVYWKTGGEDVYLNHEDYYVGSNWVHDLGEWIDGSSANAPNPCLSNEANIQKVITKANKVLGSKDTVWVSQNDSTEYCKCDDCMAIYREDGSRAATLIRLCNRVCESLESSKPNAKILTLAYQYSVTPPKVTKIHKNVIVYFCTIDNCMSCPYSDTSCVLNKQITENFTGWSELCEKVYIWDYSTNFTYNVSPYPTFDTMLENARWFHENGARGVFNNAVTGTNGEFGELRAYMLTRIYRDPYMTKEEYYTHMDNFLKGYYGSGWKYIREYIDTVEAWANEKHWNCHAPIGSIFDLEMVAADENVAYLNLLWDQAEAGASGSTQLNRVKRSRLSCTYLIQNATFDSMVTNGTDATREAYYAANEAFYSELKNFGVQWRESGSLNNYDKYSPPINW